MALKPAPHRSPSGRRIAACLGLAASLGALGFAGCTSPQPEVIARFPGDASPDASGGSAGETGETGGPLMVSPQRGRVKVVDGNLVSDIGTPLRGLLLPVDTGWSLTDYDLDVVTSYAQDMGLNTVHVYLEDAGQVTGSMERDADALVAQTARVGMYLILGVGTGLKLNEFDPTKLNDFWTLYAARYANEPHVLFEIQNNPEATCASTVQAKTLDMEHTMYKLIRSVAPDSHVLLLSATSLIKATVLEDAITNLSSDVDWSNASIDMDVTDVKAPCTPIANLSELTSVAQAHGVPLLVGQLPPTGWGPYITALEQAKLGWVQYTYFADQTQRTLASYLSAVKAAGVTWCPDQGTFPQDSRTCR